MSLCGPFRDRNSNADTVREAMCGVKASAGQTFTVSMCSALFAGAKCTGSTVLRIYSSTGVEVVYDATGTGNLPPAQCITGGHACAQLQYTVPAGTPAQTYLTLAG